MYELLRVHAVGSTTLRGYDGGRKRADAGSSIYICFNMFAVSVNSIILVHNFFPWTWKQLLACLSVRSIRHLAFVTVSSFLQVLTPQEIRFKAYICIIAKKLSECCSLLHARNANFFAISMCNWKYGALTNHSVCVAHNST